MGSPFSDGPGWTLDGDIMRPAVTGRQLEEVLLFTEQGAHVKELFSRAPSFDPTLHAPFPDRGAS